MEHYPPSVKTAIAHLAKLPGIGEKTAERLAMYILRSPKDKVIQLARSLVEVKEKVRLCRQCFGMSDESLCRICADPTRDASVICVVEQPADMASVEKAGVFRGKYHILQGALSPMDGIGPENLRIKELLARIAAGGLEEIIVATSTSVEGDTTAAYLAEMLGPYSVNVSRIASGVPVGGDLKYVDQVTLKRALESRYGI
jgi:recombination protein RecR